MSVGVAELVAEYQCRSSPCVNGGTCQENPQKFTYECKCPKHYHGKNCQFGTHIFITVQHSYYTNGSNDRRGNNNYYKKSQATR